MNVAQQIRAMRIIALKPEQMRGMWPHIEGYFQSFQDRSRGAILAYDLLAQCMSGDRQCWIATDGHKVSACALTEVQSGPKKVVILSFCAGENMGEWWQDMVRTIRKWAKSIGSKRLTAIHRPGWKKFLEKEGFKMTHMTSDIDL